MSKRQQNTTKPSKRKGTKGSQRPVDTEMEKFQRRLAAVAKATAPSTQPAQAPTLAVRQAEAGTLQQVGREADMAWAGVKRIMSLLNVENKHVYYNLSGANITQAGSVLDLCSLISQGVGGAQRIGDSLKILRVHVTAQLMIPTSGNTRQAATLVLGHSKDGVPAVADVFAVTSSSTSGLAFPSDTYQKADKWSQHRTLPLGFINSATTSMSSLVSDFVEFDVKFGHDVLYTNASTTTASGNVWLAYISNEPTNYPTLDVAVDIEFVDN